jgi:hypothetical protein
MKRVHIENEFTQWAEYLARYFGHDLLIYDAEGRLMWGSPADIYTSPEVLQKDPYTSIVYRDIGEIVAYLVWASLTPGEEQILATLIPFIESQLDDEGA